MEIKGIGVGIFFKLVFTTLFFLNFSFSHSADLTEHYLKNKPSGNSLNEKQWQKLKDDYKYKAPEIKESKERKIKKINPIQKGGGWLKFVAYCIIFILLGGLIYWLARNGFLGERTLSKTALPFDINTEPEDISALKIDPLLAQALLNKDYKLATRLRFLALLQSLSQQGQIAWKRDNTNSNYKLQLAGKPIQLGFWQICNVYEKVWYGNYSLDEKAYQNVSEKFDVLFLSLNRKINV